MHALGLCAPGRETSVFAAGGNKLVYEWSHSVSYTKITDTCQAQCTFANTTSLGPASFVEDACGSGVDAGAHGLDSRSHDAGSANETGPQEADGATAD